MTIDKQKLQKLLWAEAASFRADCADWKRNTEALQEFLGEKTVEEVALDLLAENDRLSASPERQIIRAAVTEAVKGIADAAAADAKAGTLKQIEQLKAENEALRKDAEQWRALVRRAESPVIGYTGCVICGVYTDHGGLPCPKTRATADAALDQGEQS